MWLLLVLLLPSLSWAKPISVDIDRNVNLQIGFRSFGDPALQQAPISVPDDAKACTLAFDRSQWTDKAAKLKSEVWISVDGKPFQFWIGMKAEGGTSGPETFIKRKLPKGTNRKVKGSYEVSGARFRSTVTVRCD